jgi:hypothetical protein
MEWFLIIQTALNLLGACLGNNGLGRAICIGFALWGGAILLLNFFN